MMQLGNGISTPLHYTGSTVACRRVRAELADMEGCAINVGRISESSRHWAQKLGVLLIPLSEDLTSLRGFIRGPPDTPFEDATFAVDITVSSAYPFEPPKARFCVGKEVLWPLVSVPWHPNVSSQTGYICCTILKEGGWGPSHSLKLLLQGLQTLLQCPEWDDPVNDEVRRMWARNPDEYEKKAREWSNKSALEKTFIDSFLSGIKIEEPLKTQSMTKQQNSGSKPNTTSEAANAADRHIIGSFNLSTKSRSKGRSRDAREWCGFNDSGTCVMM